MSRSLPFRSPYAPASLLALGIALAGCDLGNLGVFGTGGSGGSAGAGGAGGEGGMSQGGSGGAGTGGAGAGTGTGGAGASSGTGGADAGSGTGGAGASAGTGGAGTGGMATGGAGGSATGGMGGGGVTPVVSCAGEQCAPGEVCCWNYQNANLDTCGAPGGCGDPFQFLTIECDGPSDCPDSAPICCGDFVQTQQGSYYTSVKCATDCSNDVTFCQGDPSVCTDGDACETSQILDDYVVCK
jgi:hypothetical protein